MRKYVNRSKTLNKTAPISGSLVILSAPSGCGKTTIMDRLLKRHPEWVRSISMTTRKPRLGEKNGEDYFFVSRQAFKRMETEREFLESATVFDKRYGTPKKFVLEHIQNGRRVLLAIDIQGTKKIKKTLGGKIPLLTIFILPPSVKVLRDRLEGRKTESPAEIQRRIEIAQDEIKAARFYDLTVVNQNLEQTILEIEKKIENFAK